MPELPEAQTIKTGLKTKVINKKIKKITARDKKVVKNSQDIIKNLESQKFVAIERLGKLLVFKTSNSKYLLIHLKMTGQLIYKKQEEIIAGGHPFDLKVSNLWGGDLPNKYSKLIIEFSDNSKLFFNTIRRFAYAKLLTSEEQLKELKDNFGIDALSFNVSFSKFKELFSNIKTNIKAFLLNQKKIAGLGNIYVDEILFVSEIRPNRKVNSLSSEEIYRIYKNIKPILRKAVKYKGTTFSNYADAEGKSGGYSRFLKVYGQEGKNCPECKGKIKKKTIAGRGTHFCPKCQK